MPVRLRITLLFAGIVFIILGMVCSGIYYFSYQARINSITIRLTNRAITTARMLGQKEIFDHRLVQRIDSFTTLALKNKTVQAYDNQNNKIYNYSDLLGDTILIDKKKLTSARLNGAEYFKIDNKEAVLYSYQKNNTGITVLSAAEDIDGKDSLDNLLKILIFCFLVGNAFVLAVGYLFSSRLLQPIRKITADVEEISAQNLTRRLKTGDSNDEWFQLSNTLNSLLNRLQESFELQRRFISNASHELSTPLTSISSQLEVTFQRERTIEYYKQVMDSIYQDVRHMSKLTRTLLEFAMASGNAGGLDINLVRVDEIILTLPMEMAKINPEYTVSLQFENLPEDEDGLLVFGNEELLFSAIKNIVVNACKYSQNHKSNILLSIEEKKITIVISDQGKGIPENELKTIFQPFYRVKENMTGEGFGLGLSLADKIIKLHKGTITVASTLGVGTSFTIELPSAKALR